MGGIALAVEVQGEVPMKQRFWLLVSAIALSPGCLDLTVASDAGVADGGGTRCEDGTRLDESPVDCIELRCIDGVFVPVADNSEIPPDDGRECTVERCQDGVAARENKPENAPCGVAPGLSCNTNGDCTGCVEAAGCGLDTPCRSHSCEQGICKYVDAPAGPAGLQTPGDCQVLVCDGAGKALSQVDTTDGATDDNECTDDQCSGGISVHPPKMPRSPCSGGVCDGTGVCVQCIEPADCGTSKPCAPFACKNETCTVAMLSQGTVLPPEEQTAGDCLQKVCDGSGGVKEVPQTSDTPDDGNSCVVKACAADGTVTTTLVGLGVPCGMTGNTVCDGVGNCRLKQGEACAAADDCANNKCVDGVCCGSLCTGACSACNVPGNEGNCAPLPLGAEDQFPMPLCTGSMRCDGTGNCLKQSGQPCVDNLECLSGTCTGSPKTCK